MYECDVCTVLVGKWMKKQNVAIVILNYLNHQDTIECIKTIRTRNYNYEIVVVDNGSNNDSSEILEKEYDNELDVHIVKSTTNLGFAKGNNLGIKYAREHLKADFVFCCNNDILFLEDDYFDKLLAKYEDNVGVIGSAIINANDVLQEEYELDLDFMNLFKSYLNAYASQNGTSFGLQGIPKGKTKILHGSALLLTPTFFKHYDGFYKRTFLYYEEPILYLMCKEKGLKQVYVPEATIKHLEDKSSELSFNNDLSVMSKYSFDSMKWLVYWAFRDYVRGFFRKQREDN